jgi:hypothetical protein
MDHNLNNFSQARMLFLGPNSAPNLGRIALKESEGSRGFKSLSATQSAIFALFARHRRYSDSAICGRSSPILSVKNRAGAIWQENGDCDEGVSQPVLDNRFPA